ncbi:MAG: hypothetical protein J0L92_29685 [Deltaproteobacteria bacterium]|nr:hypothetical protein [Deltaproteobacteria bacterium]
MTRLVLVWSVSASITMLAGCDGASGLEDVGREDASSEGADASAPQTDAASLLDAPGLDAPGLDAPGLDAGSTDAFSSLDAPRTSDDATVSADAHAASDAPLRLARCGDEPSAFPGAEGFGACARGGRGGRVIHVTTLASRGAGSLQAALDETGPRTIVFDVSGVIDGVPELQHGEVTIAGQTSPSGVTLRGLLIQGDEVCEGETCPLPRVRPDDVIVRFLRLRPAGMGDDGLRFHHASRVIVDHVSIGNAEDEAVQISFSRDVTLQWSVLAETLTTGHAVEYGGILVNYSDPARGFPNTRLSLHHDLLVRIAGRLPELTRENHRGDHGAIAELELVSNVVWDPRRPITAATLSNFDGEVGWALDLVDLFFFVRPDHPHAMFVIEPAPTLAGSTVHLDGNTLSRFPALRDWQIANRCDCNDFGELAARGELAFDAPPRYARDTRLSPPVDVTRTSRGLALADELARGAGVLPHDAMDRRLTTLVTDRGFDDAPLDTNPYADALTLEPTAPLPADTDRDGMPDAWERERGLDPARDDGAAIGALSLSRLGVEGYSNLEVFLAERAAALVGG